MRLWARLHNVIPPIALRRFPPEACTTCMFWWTGWGTEWSATLKNFLEKSTTDNDNGHSFASMVLGSFGKKGPRAAGLEVGGLSYSPCLSVLLSAEASATMTLERFVFAVLRDFTEFKGQSVMQTKMLDPDLYDEHKRTPNSHLGDRPLPNMLRLKNIYDTGILHCDLKPEDVLLTPSSHVAIGDFSLSGKQSGPGDSCHKHTPGFSAFSSALLNCVTARTTVPVLGDRLHNSRKSSP
ncbi:hypothetical protein BKA82DRAFT_4340865 [Pisolithus tinctorius]|nr:hypothetical protein BKA82DRAFT_4340865 [Pisolithus tinctorius]